MVRLALLLAFLLFLIACGDTVTDQYATRADAEADLLFMRGWLPNIIPESSKNIVTINNLDSNTSEGGFEFNVEDSEGFIANLRKVDSSELHGKDQKDLLKQNYVPYEYNGHGSNWVFLINSKKGNCYYWMKLRADIEQ